MDSESDSSFDMGMDTHDGHLLISFVQVQVETECNGPFFADSQRTSVAGQNWGVSTGDPWKQKAKYCICDQVP